MARKLTKKEQSEIQAELRAELRPKPLEVWSKMEVAAWVLQPEVGNFGRRGAQ